MRPFARGAKVCPLGCSRPLQRAIVDFAADQPFAQARNKLVEHYGVKIGESTIQRITFGHAEAMFEAGREGLDFPEEPGSSKPIVVETDGGMVPIVEPSLDAKDKDKRKGKKLLWREAKLSLAHALGSRTRVRTKVVRSGGVVLCPLVGVVIGGGWVLPEVPPIGVPVAVYSHDP